MVWSVLELEAETPHKSQVTAHFTVFLALALNLLIYKNFEHYHIKRCRKLLQREIVSMLAKIH